MIDTPVKTSARLMFWASEAWSPRIGKNFNLGCDGDNSPTTTSATASTSDISRD